MPISPDSLSAMMKRVLSYPRRPYLNRTHRETLSLHWVTLHLFRTVNNNNNNHYSHMIAVAHNTNPSRKKEKINKERKKTIDRLSIIIV